MLIVLQNTTRNWFVPKMIIEMYAFIITACILCAAVISQKQDIMLIDTERRFIPVIWPSFLPPIVLWIHVVVHLVDAPGANQGQQFLQCLAYVHFM